MLEEFLPITIERFGGLVTFWPPDKVPIGASPDCRNVRFSPSSVLVREGLRTVFSAGTGKPVTGLMSYVQASGIQMPLIMDAGGNLFIERPVGGGALIPVKSSLVVPVANSLLQAANAYGHVYLAFGDGSTGMASPAVFDGTNLDPYASAGPTGSTTVADGASGHLTAGLRYGVVLFKTRSGYVTAPQAPFSWTAAGSRQVTVSNLPLGPANVVARIAAFTVAGGSSAGPFFYIGASESSNGFTQTATVVPDNSSTSATFDFDDVFLSASTDITAAQRKLQLPLQTAVFYSPTTRRLIWWGDPDNPSVLRLSEPDDPETVYGDTGLIVVAQDNGERLTSCFEYAGQLYAAKEHSLYVITPSADPPSSWQVAQLTRKVGVSGPRALDVCDEFTFLVHRSGAYYYDGGQPQIVSQEIEPLWQQINWRVADQIWVHIDAETRQVRIGVPLERAVVPNKILKIDYQQGWDDSVTFSRISGEEHAYPGRKWSIDDIAAMSAIRVERRLPDPPQATDSFPPAVATSQILLASADTDGNIHMLDGNSLDDNGTPISAHYQTAFLKAADVSNGPTASMHDLAGVTGTMSGAGAVTVVAVLDGDPQRTRHLRTLLLSPSTPTEFKVGCHVSGSRLALRFSAGEASSARFEIKRLFAWLRASWAVRP